MAEEDVPKGRRVADGNDQSSSRRGFVRKIVSVAALGGLGTLLLGRQSDSASAAGPNQIAFYDASSSLTSSSNLRWYDEDGNLVAGYNGNTVKLGAIGATISGGGASGAENKVTDDYGTVGGGLSNRAGNNDETVTNARYATVGGGYVNTASTQYATVGGGDHNGASGSYATVPGGRSNAAAGDYCFAAGRRAKIDATHGGSFLFADMSNYDFNSTAANEFAVRATGGARFVTAIDGFGNPTKTTVITSAGNLGIGTSAPLYGLDLRTPGSTAAQMHFASTNTDAGGYFVSASDANFFISGGSAYNGASWIAKASSAYEFGGGPAGVRFFFDSGLTPGLSFAPTTRLIINSSGNVGIGTATPGSRLHVTSDSGTTGDTGVTVEIPGIGTRRIIVGAPDSAGSGYRTLKVAN